MDFQVLLNLVFLNKHGLKPFCLGLHFFKNKTRICEKFQILSHTTAPWKNQNKHLIIYYMLQLSFLDKIDLDLFHLRGRGT